MKIYKCKSCEFKTGNKREIRKHVREVHHIKGGRDALKLHRVPLSEFYEGVEV